MQRNIQMAIEIIMDRMFPIIRDKREKTIAPRIPINWIINILTINEVVFDFSAASPIPQSISFLANKTATTIMV